MPDPVRVFYSPTGKAWTVGADEIPVRVPEQDLIFKPWEGPTANPLEWADSAGIVPASSEQIGHWADVFMEAARGLKGFQARLDETDADERLLPPDVGIRNLLARIAALEQRVAELEKKP